MENAERIDSTVKQLLQIQTVYLETARSLASIDRDMAMTFTGLPLEVLDILQDQGVIGILRLTESQLIPMKMHLPSSVVKRVLEGEPGADWLAASSSLDLRNKAVSKGQQTGGR